MDIATISPAAAQDVAAEVEAVAERAFAAHPDFDGRAIAAAFAAHAAKPGFVAVATRHDGALAGFAYGFRSFTGEPPSGWYQRVLDAVGSAADHRIRGQFEIPWMAVDPDHQGRGAGRRLLDALLAAAPPRHAWLVTGAGDPAAASTRRSAGRPSPSTRWGRTGTASSSAGRERENSFPGSAGVGGQVRVWCRHRAPLAGGRAEPRTRNDPFGILLLQGKVCFL